MDADHDPIVAFLGLGLISGSLAGALKRSNWRADLIAWGPRAPSLERGVALGLIDRFSLDLPTVVAEADVIVIGAPPEATAQLLPEVLDLAASSESPWSRIWPALKASLLRLRAPTTQGLCPGIPSRVAKTAVSGLPIRSSLMGAKSF